VHPDPAKVEKMRDYPVPTDVTKVRVWHRITESSSKILHILFMR
jgi:hypothetical protein